MRHAWLTSCLNTVPLLAILCLVFCPIVTVSSQVTTSVIVEPATVSAVLGEQFSVTVKVSNVQNLYGLEVILDWNPAVLRVANVDLRLGVETFSDGVLHESSFSPPVFIAENNLTQTSGEYRLVATSMAPVASFTGSGNIVRITFEAVSVGNAAVDLESQLFDYPPADRDPRISLAIEHSTQDSSVTVKSTPPVIVVLSPENREYNESSVSLVFTLNEPCSWTGFSLDGKENVTVAGNFTLNDLSNSVHSVKLYANDTSGNMGVSETRNFTVAVPEPEPEPFPLTPVAVASVVVAVAAFVGLLWYFKKRQSQRELT